MHPGLFQVERRSNSIYEDSRHPHIASMLGICGHRPGMSVLPESQGILWLGTWAGRQHALSSWPHPLYPINYSRAVVRLALHPETSVEPWNHTPHVWTPQSDRQGSIGAFAGEQLVHVTRANQWLPGCEGGEQLREGPERRVHCGYELAQGRSIATIPDPNVATALSNYGKRTRHAAGKHSSAPCHRHPSSIASAGFSSTRTPLSSGKGEESRTSLTAPLVPAVPLRRRCGSG